MHSPQILDICSHSVLLFLVSIFRFWPRPLITFLHIIICRDQKGKMFLMAISQWELCSRRDSIGLQNTYKSALICYCCIKITTDFAPSNDTHLPDSSDKQGWFSTSGHKRPKSGSKPI